VAECGLQRRRGSKKVGGQEVAIFGETDSCKFLTEKIRVLKKFAPKFPHSMGFPAQNYVFLTEISQLMYNVASIKIYFGGRMSRGEILSGGELTWARSYFIVVFFIGGLIGGGGLTTAYLYPYVFRTLKMFHGICTNAVQH